MKKPFRLTIHKRSAVDLAVRHGDPAAVAAQFLGTKAAYSRPGFSQANPDRAVAIAYECAWLVHSTRNKTAS